MVMMIGPPPPPPPGGGGAANPANRRWNWRRLNVFTNLGSAGLATTPKAPSTCPPPGSSGDDWGPANNDVHRRFNVGISSSQLRNLNANLNINVSSAPPYTIRTGTDDNGDLVFNDRPLGVGRNTVRATGQWTINGFFNYGWTFGKPVERPGGISFRNDGGGLAVSQAAAQSTGRYRLSLIVNVQNLTNHGNLTGYTGTLTSINSGSRRRSRARGRWISAWGCRSSRIMSR